MFTSKVVNNRETVGSLPHRLSTIIHDIFLLVVDGSLGLGDQRNLQISSEMFS